MRSVFLCSPMNSRMFTSCCNTAICDNQSFCPRCGEEVYPGQNHSNHERAMMRWDMAFGPTRRANAARNTWMKS